MTSLHYDIEKSLEQRIGSELTMKFRNACVAVCGLGGLGSNIAPVLARSGIGRIHLIDFDIVDISNLNRQQYEISQIGMYKTEAMKKIIQRISPCCKIIIDTVKINEDNLYLLSDDDIICEAFDNPESKAMLVNGILENMPDKYIVAASGMAGLYSGNTIQTRKITEKFYLCGDEKSDIEKDKTLFAPRVMLCASHQANMILRIIAEKFDV